MMHRRPPRAQRGAILIVGLIVLMLITVVVTAAFKFSTTNLKSVSNMQVRNEAIAAANRSIEEGMELWSFERIPAHEPFNVDIDLNGSTDYVVTLNAAVCLGATASSTAPDAGSETKCDLSGRCKPGAAEAPSVYNVTWDLDMTATSASSGAKVRMHQGVSKTISQEQCDAACPPVAGSPCA